LALEWQNSLDKHSTELLCFGCSFLFHQRERTQREERENTERRERERGEWRETERENTERRERGEWRETEREQRGEREDGERIQREREGETTPDRERERREGREM